MWILESSSELFQGRRMWLKPGKSYLFGRVKKDGVRFAIDNKTISRKHFIIKVDDVTLEDVGNIHARTNVTIEDQNSKAGTHVNGEHIKGSTKELKNEENYIKPGSLPEDLVIKWLPCVLTFNLLKKEVKAGALKKKQERVKDLDVKAVSEYVTGHTTHLVVNKRNTPKSLQALIDGKHLVAESYIDALEYATTPSALNEEENLSPLEQDFDSAWPDPYDYLPPQGRELTMRPAESYKPDLERKNIFENFTFVFLDQNQHDNLLPPLTTGHGKALLCKIVVGETTTEELVTFLHNAAGRKGFGDAQKEFDKGGVILVRFKGDTGAEDWTNALINETSLRLDQRAIDQGEFLDAILANDAFLLRQTVPYESNHDGLMAPPSAAVSLAPAYQTTQAVSNDAAPQVTQHNGSPAASAPQTTLRSPSGNDQHDASSRRPSQSSLSGQSERQQSVNEDESTQPLKKARFMVPKKSRVFDFDDDFDPNMIAPYQEDEEETAVQHSPSDPPFTPTQAGSKPDTVKEEANSVKKRTRSPSREASVSFDDDLDDLLPAAAAMKRRKLAKGIQKGTPAEMTKSKPLSALLKKPKQEKEINVREVAKAQRKAEEEKAQREQEDIEEDIRIEPGQSLPVYDVETVIVDVPVRKRPNDETSQAASDRWDSKWNGRKNFKGFRRAKDNVNGEAGIDTRRRNHTKVIVPLVDAKRFTYGIGDQYWDKSEEEKEREREKKRKASQRTTQSQSDLSRNSHQQKSQTLHDTDHEHGQEETNEDPVQTSSTLLRLLDEAAGVMDHAIDIGEPRRTRASDTQTQTTTTTQSTRGAKRSANGSDRGGSAKRQKTLPVTVVHGSDSDDSDDMKFRFGSRRRGRGKT